MIAALLVALVVQAPKSSALGRDKPWWEKINPGDEVTIRTLPGTAIPMVKAWRYSRETGRFAREERWIEAFARAVDAKDWRAIHGMVDRDEVRYMFVGPGGAEATVISIRSDPVLKTAVAEVDRGGRYFVPVAFIGPGKGRPHPDRGRLPVLIRRSRDVSDVECDDEDCARVDAIPYAEAEREREGKQGRPRRPGPRAAEDARRRTPG